MSRFAKGSIIAAGSTPESPQGAPEELDPDVVRAFAHQAKALLRTRARGLRKSVPAAALEKRSRAIVERLLELDAVRASRSVALFYPIENSHEVDLRSLDATLRARGASVHYPSMDPENKAMTFRDPSDPAAMVELGMMVVEPDPSLPEPETLDLIVVPALMVDPRGHRLGYGGGYYDRTLPRWSPPAISIAVAFDFQVAADLPIGPFDVACDAVLTDLRIIKPLADS